MQEVIPSDVGREDRPATHPGHVAYLRHAGGAARAIGCVAEATDRVWVAYEEGRYDLAHQILAVARDAARDLDKQLSLLDAHALLPLDAAQRGTHRATTDVW